MSHHAIIDKDGWVDGIVMTECGFNPEDYSAVRYVELEGEEIQKITHSQLTMFHDGENFCQIKDPKAIWKRIRGMGFQGKNCVEAHKNHLERLDDIYPDIPGGVMINKGKEVKKDQEPLFETEFRPGLKIVSATEDDADLWEASMIKSGLFAEKEAWTKAAQWLSDPKVWCIKTIWKDKILQIETYHFNDDGTVFAGFTSHLDRTRPLWFWRQMAKPVFNALYAHGFEVIKTSIRKDRRDWVDSLKEIYGATELRETDQGVILRYKIEDSLTLIGKWPERRTLGTSWKWEKDGVLMREATDADLPSLIAAMETDWGNNKRKDLALTRLNDMWNLDSGTIVLALKDDKIINARVYRERTDPTISIVVFPFKGGIKTKDTLSEEFKDHEVALEGFDIWQVGAGYKVSSFFIETKLHAPQSQTWAGMGWKVFNQDSEITECRKVL